jgi:beta-N-acetylhexosaminidase
MATALSELAGSVLITGIPGTRLDSATREALERIRPSGVILFRRNFESFEQLRALTAELHDLPSQPLVSIDHEGGRVMRIGEPFTAFPAARAAGDTATAAALGRAMAVELAAAGIDIDFAPVLDVDSNPANPIIGDRAFSSSATVAAELAVAFARGMRDAGVLPCGKHFPGHGDTDRDSHLELPVVHKSRAELDAVELVPFRAAIAAGIPMLMTAHVLYPALDPEHPATLSARILRGLLRGELGYDGIVVSDDLEMRALGDDCPVADAAVASLRAGCDWLLICNDFENTRRAARRITEALGAGDLDAEALRASARRIAALREARRRPLATTTLPCAAHQQLCDRMAATLARA